MKEEKTNRLLRVLLVSLGLLLYVALSLGITALLFSLGEKERYPLGSQGEWLNLQIALYHIREVEEGGDYVIVIGDRWRYFSLIPISERLPHAIASLFSLNWSYSTAMDNASLLSVMSIALRSSFMAFLFFAVAGAFAFLGRFMPRFKVPYYVYIIIASVCLLIAMLSPLWSSSLGWPIPFLSVAVLTLLVGDANAKRGIGEYVSHAFFVIGIAWILFHLIGLYSGLDSDAYSLSALLMQGIKGEDNHTYALAFLFLSILTALPIGIGFYIKAARKPKVE